MNEKLLISKDLIMLSGVAGFIGAIVKNIFSGIPYLFHITQDFGILIAGRIIFHAKDFPLDWLHITLSIFAHLIFGSIIGVGLGILYLLSGKDFYLLKGAIYGLLVWFIVRNYLVTLSVPGEREQLDAITTAVSFGSHILYGLISGYIIAIYNRFAPST